MDCFETADKGKEYVVIIGSVNVNRGDTYQHKRARYRRQPGRSGRQSIQYQYLGYKVTYERTRLVRHERLKLDIKNIRSGGLSEFTVPIHDLMEVIHAAIGRWRLDLGDRSTKAAVTPNAATKLR